MTARLAARLAADPEFRSWHTLPTPFVEEACALSDEAVLDLVSRLWKLHEHRFLYAAVVIVERHPSVARRMKWKVLEPLGEQMTSWGDVDMFVCLAGPAWRSGRLSDARVLRWTQSPNRWWRRAALVCTVYLNRKARGGAGDSARTLAVCEVLAGDHDDMVAKGLSWALRDLIAHDRRAVEQFLIKHDEHLHALVKREVRCKLETGRKHPPRKRRS